MKNVFFVLARAWDEFKISIFRAVFNDTMFSTSLVVGSSSLALRIFLYFNASGKEKRSCFS